MIIKMTFKDPDGVFDSIRDSVRDSFEGMDLSEEELEMLVESRTESVSDKLSKWIKYGEYVYIEFDTEAETAVVKEVK